MKKSMSWVALFLCVVLAAAVLVIPTSAVTAADYCLADLSFSTDSTKGNLTLDGAKILNVDIVTGAVTVELTKEKASLKMVFQDADNVYNDMPINVKDTSKHPYFAYDYSSADDVEIEDLIFHYTRKDKQADGKLADLYLESMEEDKKYEKYRKVSGDNYGVWDWAAYLLIDKKDTGLFDDGIHRFYDVDCTLKGTVGKRIVFYRMGIYYTDDNAILQLGTVRPEPTEDPVTPPEPDKDPLENITLPENVIEGTAFTTATINTTITDKSQTVVTDLSDANVAKMNLKWTANVLLAPAEDGNYTVASVATGDGKDPTYPDAGEGYIVLGLHGGESDNETDAFKLKAKWAALEVGSVVVLQGYDLKNGTVGEGAVIYALPAGATPPAVSGDTSSEDVSSVDTSSEATSSEDTSSEATSSTAVSTDESKEETGKSDSLTWLWIVIAVVAVAAVAAVVVVISKKKK